MSFEEVSDFLLVELSVLLPEVLSVLLPASVLLLAELSVLFSEELADLLLFDPHATVPKDNIAAMHNIVPLFKISFVL
ncbi:hypothetical protein PNW85_00045 [[Ruminococcus] gnavus]|uniref:Uncharacterized protein n=1 Tax=Mediterraneibacter gnavus TaxID=33038 RepID=A0AAJ3KND5_MEDGN|nr:hypothetical protein [Mediterraneibacter gnavus]MCB5458797.1 hypothetical protein [Mediterraneibacter gnavus]MDB8678057.1 hypothetical protein [Mediterraneibacter gnavus]MDB8685078.1 hypothetical protein [Mediterraneibacter gnavus]NSI30947.1 hypothetical protein [Mediterraneibacter gnavus]NSI60002.1 hypothetical protein [Mediterraneibacter gnavus]